MIITKYYTRTSQRVPRLEDGLLGAPVLGWASVSRMSPEDQDCVSCAAQLGGGKSLKDAAEGADHERVRTWSCVLAMVAALGGIADDGHATTNSDVTALLLTKRDVGASYSLNRGFTLRWTLAERSEGMGSTLRRELAAKWVAGAQSGFGGSAAVSHQSIVSTADVFRTSSGAPIRKIWEAKYLSLGSGVRLTIPRGAPGAARFLMRGRMLSNGRKLEVLLYQWQSGKTLQSVWLIARPGVPRVSRLIALARVQEA